MHPLNLRYPATMHGAFATGLREAANIMAALAAEKGVPVSVNDALPATPPHQPYGYLHVMQT